MSLEQLETIVKEWLRANPTKSLIHLINGWESAVYEERVKQRERELDDLLDSLKNSDLDKPFFPL
jgi:hypothetical protein